MVSESLPFKSLYLAALDLSPPERIAFLNRECGSDFERKNRLSELLTAFDAAVNVPGNPQIESSTTTPSESSDKQIRIVRARNRKNKLVYCSICTVLGIGAITYWSWHTYNLKKQKYQEQIDAYQKLNSDHSRRLSVETDSWGTATYQYIAEFNANLFAISGVEIWKLAPKEQLDFVQHYTQWKNPHNNMKIEDRDIQSRIAVGYQAAWNWGVGDGFFRIKNYSKAIEHLTISLKYAESAFGKVDQLTLAIRKLLALTYHLSQQDDTAFQLISIGDQFCREAIESDPSILDIRNGKAFNSSWSKLIALAVILPGDTAERTSESELWDRRLSICKSYPDHVTANYFPRYEDGYTDFFGMMSQSIVDRPDDIERVLRKQLSRADMTAKKEPTIWSEREPVTIKLAKHLLERKDGRHQEAEDLLLIALQELEPLWNGKTKMIPYKTQNPQTQLLPLTQPYS